MNEINMAIYVLYISFMKSCQKIQKIHIKVSLYP